jgi:hypothetical protein
LPGGWVGFRADPDAVAKRNTTSATNRTPIPQFSGPWPHHTLPPKLLGLSPRHIFLLVPFISVTCAPRVRSCSGKRAYTGTLLMPLEGELENSVPLWLMTEIFITENIFFLLYDSSCNKLLQFNQRHMVIKSHYWCGIVRGQNFNEWNLAHSFTPSTHSSPLHLMRPFYRRGVMELTSGHLQRMVTWKSRGSTHADSLTCGRIICICNLCQWR